MKIPFIIDNNSQCEKCEHNVVHIYHISCGSIIILKHHKGHTVAVWAMGCVSFLKHTIIIIITLANLILVA